MTDFGRLLEKHPRPWRIDMPSPSMMHVLDASGLIVDEFDDDCIGMSEMWAGIIEAVNGYGLDPHERRRDADLHRHRLANDLQNLHYALDK